MKRLACPAINGNIPQGHYKLSSVKRYGSPMKSKGSGSVYVADLNHRDIRALTLDEKIEETLDDNCYRIDDRRGVVGGLLGDESRAIIGGGEALPTSISFANYQTLTKPISGVRVYNSDLAKLMNYLEPRLRCLQLVIFTVQ